MNVLVTGADGFVGQHVVAALLARGHTVTGAVRGEGPMTGTLPEADVARVAWRAFDLRDAASVERVVAEAAPDAILHLAGVASVSQSFREPEATFDINATGTLRLLVAVRQLPAVPVSRPVLLVSSGEVYGSDGTEEAPLTEEMPLRPVTPYGASKACAELAVEAFRRSYFAGRGAPGIATIRAGNIIGGGDWAADRLVPSIALDATTREAAGPPTSESRAASQTAWAPSRQRSKRSITSPITGKQEPVTEIGYHFRSTPENLDRWHRWWRAAGRRSPWPTSCVMRGGW